MAVLAVPQHPHLTCSFHDFSSLSFQLARQGEDALRTGEWVLSKDDHPKYAGQESRVRVEPCSLEGGRYAGDYGLLLSESHKHYAVGARLPKPVDNAGKVGPIVLFWC